MEGGNKAILEHVKNGENLHVLLIKLMFIQ